MAEKINLPAESWDNLMPELLPLIAQKLGDILDFIHFRAVCKRWWSATNLSDSPPSFPWLVQIKRGFDESDGKHDIVFHRLPSCMTPVSFSLALPLAYKRHMRNELLLEEIDEFRQFVWNGGPSDLKCDHLGRDVSHHEVLPLPPVGVLPKLLNFQRYDKKKQLQMTFPHRADFVYHKETFFFCSGRSDIHVVYDSGPPVTNISSFARYLELLVDSSLKPKSCLISTTNGLLMVVQKYAQPEDDVRYEDFEFVVLRIEFDDKKFCWTKLSTIGDLMLFLDEHNNFGLMASDYNGFSGNCIYFITKLKGSSKSHSTHYLLAGYNMEEQKSFEVCFLGEESSSGDRRFCWFIPVLA